MYSQVFPVLLLVSCSLAYPRTYQEQRQIYYPQPLPVHQRLAAAGSAGHQLYLQQQPLLQVPASTSLLPNNVNNGVRYGQHQLLYVVPSGAQVYYEEQAGTGSQEGGTTGGSEGGSFIDSVFNVLGSYVPFGSGSNTEKPAEAAGGVATVEGGEQKPETPEKLQKPARLEQQSVALGAENFVASSDQLRQQAAIQQLQQQYQQQQQQQQQQPQLLHQYIQQQPQQLHQFVQQQPQFTQKNQLQQQPIQQQQSLEKYFALRNQQFLQNSAPAASVPSANLLYYKNVPQFADYNIKPGKPGSAAITLQRYLSKANENSIQTTTEKESGSGVNNGTENEEQTTPEGEHHHSHTEEMGPSIAQAKPQAVSVAGPGGVAAAAPVGTAIVGPGGMALSAPQATAVAGTKPKPPGNDKIRTYFPRNSAAAAFYPY